LSAFCIAKLCFNCLLSQQGCNHNLYLFFSFFSFLSFFFSLVTNFIFMLSWRDDGSKKCVCMYVCMNQSSLRNIPGQQRSSLHSAWDFNLFSFGIIELLEVKSVHARLLCKLFNYCQPLPNFCNCQLVISIPLSYSERSDIHHIWMPSHVYKNIIVRNVFFPHNENSKDIHEYFLMKTLYAVLLDPLKWQRFVLKHCCHN
jgi:hypothetical protein